jgi:hypothetical protein
MERLQIPTTISFEMLLSVLNQQPLNPGEHYRNVYIIQMIQRLQILINQDKRRVSNS